MKAMNDPLLTPTELAELLKIPVKTLYGWRYEHRGPAAVKVGRHLRYRETDVNRWLDEHAR